MALKVGTEDKKKVITLAVLGLLLVVVAVYEYGNIFGGSTPPPTVAPTAAVQPAPAPATAASSSGAGTAREAPKAPRVGNNLDPTLHPEIMAQAESLEYSGKGRNIFSMSSAPVDIEEVKAPIRGEPEVAAPTGPPPPPPIELKFFGYSQQAAVRRAFLLHGDDVFIANEGDTVDHRYKVLKINPLSVDVTDLPYNNTQTLPFIPN
jgi:hypothetical protein